MVIAQVLIIQTIRRDPSPSVWIDGAPNMSSADPPGADQTDVETSLRIWRWGVRRAATFRLGSKGRAPPDGPALGRLVIPLVIPPDVTPLVRTVLAGQAARRELREWHAVAPARRPLRDS